MALKYYALVNNYGIFPPSWHPYLEDKKPKSSIPTFTPSDAKEISLAEYDAAASVYITAHRLKDYRHRTFTLVPMPNVKLIFDYILEARGIYR